MRAGYSAQQLRDAEAPRLAAGEPLMRRAAAGLAVVLRELLPPDPADGTILVLAGTGDNGGDALFAAAELAAAGVSVVVVPTGGRLHPEGRTAAIDAGARIEEHASPDRVSEIAGEAALVVDGIVGTGTSARPALRGRARELVGALLPVVARPDGPRVVAVDLPSGIHPDDGSVPDPVVLPASVTVTFGAFKAGLLRGPAVELAGEVRLIDIGLGPELARFEPIVEAADPPRSMGVEEELLIVDEETGMPTALARAVLRLPTADGAESQFEPELQQEMLEVVSEPCTSREGLRRAIVRGRADADAKARALGARVVALGTSPVPVEPHIVPKARFLWMQEHFGITTRTLICGFHVHVGIRDTDEGVAVLDRIRAWLPVLTALSANSPFHDGLDTGFASYRTTLWTRWPSSGPNPVFGSAAAYARHEEELLASGVLLDPGMIYFDARLSRAWPTVEIRVADVCLDSRDAVTIAVLARALVETAAREAAVGVAPPRVSSALLRLASWQAALTGVSGNLVHPASGEPAPAAAVVDALLDHAGEALADAGDRDAVRAGTARILERGSGAVWQRTASRRLGSLAEVVREAADRTVAG